MFKTLRDIGIATFVYANARRITRLSILVILFIATEIIYDNWKQPEIMLDASLRQVALYVYTLIQLAFLIIFLFNLKDLVWGERAKEIVDAKKSFKNMSSDLSDIEDVNKYPKLK